MCVQRCKLLSDWNNKIRHNVPEEQLSIINEYAYKFLMYAYTHDMPITSSYLYNTRDGNTDIDKIYDMYSFTIQILKKNTSKTPFNNSYITMKIRSYKLPDSERPIINGIYDIYLGNKYAAEDANCSYYDLSDDNQIFNIAYQTTIYDLVQKILANDKLNTWLILQGINVRNIL